MTEPAAPGLLLLRIALLPVEVLDLFGCPEGAAASRRADALDRDLRDRERSASEVLFRLAGPRPEASPDRAGWTLRNALLALRRDVYNRRPLRSGVLETAGPAIPEGLRSELSGILRDRDELEGERRREADRYRMELERERGSLVAAARDEGFREGIWLANRSLRGALDKLERREPSRWRNEETHAALTILSYLARGATKTSPNSLFCATALVGLGDALRVEGSGGVAGAATSLNVFEARKVASCLAADAALRPALCPRPNPTVRETGEGWTYWRPPTLREEGDEEVRSEIGGNPVLRRVLELCAGGDVTWGRLCGILAKETGLPASDLEGFLDGLVARRVLVAEVEIPFNEARPLAALARETRRLGAHPEWLEPVEGIEKALDDLPPAGSPARVPEMKRIGECLAALPHVRPLEADVLFRVDAASGFRTTLPRAAVDEVAAALDRYARLVASFYPRPERSPYAASFLKRFPSDTELPLLDLYHAFEGSGSAPPLASFPEPSRPEGREVYRRFRERLIGASRAGESELRIPPDELDSLLGDGEGPRWTAGALFQIAPDAEGALSSPGARFVLNGVFPGAGLAFSRFHRLLGRGSEGEERFARVLRDGWAPLIPEGAVGAEITYTHWGRTANASLRPRVFPHEIELPGDKASPGAAVIPLADLTVRYDASRERFRLRSTSLGTEVVPFLSSGVRPEGFVDFLVHVGMQDLTRVAYFPGFDGKGMVRWPRVTVERTVFFRERWMFGPEEGPGMFARDGTASPGPDWFAGVQRWREHYRLPRRVFAASAAAGKPFYLDLESPMFVEMLRRALAGGDPMMAERMVMTEMLPAPENLWIRDRRGGYASEFLLQASGPRGTPEGKTRRR